MIIRSISFFCFFTISIEGLSQTAYNDFCRQSKEESLIPIHPGMQGIQPFWNEKAKMFKYAPAFMNESKCGLLKKPKLFRYSAFSFTNNQHYIFTAKTPFEALTPIWDKIPTGNVYLKVEGVGEDDKECFLSGTHFFYKAALFCPPYPDAKYSYKDALLRGLKFMYSQKHMKQWFVSGKPDHNEMELYCYPAKLVGSVVKGMLMYNKYFPENDTALSIACKAADYMISNSEPAGAPLEYLPQTYEGNKITAEIFGNQILMNEPSSTGTTYLELFDKTKDKKYFNAALNIANTYIKRQLPSGTWYIRIDKKTGNPASEVLCIPIGIVNFLTLLVNQYHEKQFQNSIDRAVNWIWKNPMKTYNWTGQFEDVAAADSYQNLTKYDASWFAQYLLENKNKDTSYLRLAKELIAFCEDQFVVWQKPEIYDSWRYSSNQWHTPCALEQYQCYVPIDASCDQMILTFMNAYENTGESIYREKAKALANSLVNYQLDDGMIKTFMFPGISEFWNNCMTYSLVMLEKMSVVK
jgi:hypothetical protein